MKTPWRLALAAALLVTAGVGAASAQTVIVRNAPPGAPVELLFEGARIAAAKADEEGNATLPGQIKAASTAGEADVRLYVDVCGGAFRVGLVDRLSLAPAVTGDCERREVQGLYVLKSSTSLLVDVGGGRAAVWLRQGPIPKEWMIGEGEVAERPERLKVVAPTGLYFSGSFASSVLRYGLVGDCGNVTDCTTKSSALSLNGGVGFWFKRWLGVEGSFIKPQTLHATGKGTSYNFDSTFESYLVTAAAKAGAPMGPVRIYGIGGLNYQRSFHSTTQTNQDTTTTIDGVDTVIPGNVQKWETATSGFGYMFGGGIEAWITGRYSLWFEIWRGQLKGKGLDNTEGTLDDRLTFFGGGFRVKLGKL